MTIAGLIDSMITLEFYAGLTTGALAARTVKGTARLLVQRGYPTKSSSQSEDDAQ